MLSQAQLQYIEQQLAQFDCNEREAQIYVESLQMGPASIQEISRSLDQNRVTIHSATEQLIKKGLLFETRKGKRRLVTAAEPESLVRLVQKKQNELNVLQVK